jgi:4-hydroxy-3-polyprenylbenzoate decarboxylase
MDKKGQKMARADLRPFIQQLENEGELYRVKAEVDWSLELSHMAKINERTWRPRIAF